MHLYIDESGARRPDRKPAEPRADRLDYFALGGVLINEEQIGEVVEAHRALLKKWNIETHLHSTKIRGRRGDFAWLGQDKAKEADFLSELEVTLLKMPVIGVACVIDRPGYTARYAKKHPEPWLLCKTAFAILVERAAKHAHRHKAGLQIFFEQAGEAEDRAIQSYARLLETEGMPFDTQSSTAYKALAPEQFKEILIGQPNRITKQVPMAQVADLFLYPIVKGGYDASYRPYEELMKARRVIDAELTAEERPHLGVKYSCFDHKK